MSDALAIRAAHGTVDMDQVRELFLEYGRSLGFSLCFQGFDEELASLPGCYAPPRGALWLASDGDAVAGVVGLRPLSAEACEMKRLYLRDAYRGRGGGRALAETAVAAAREKGYAAMRLDTLHSMRYAQALYDALGFREIAPYYDNPLPGVRYFELRLASRRGI